MRGARLVDAAGLLGVGLFAFLCSYEAGRRGFFPYDQSIVFDGAYRIVSGQVPYKDFLLWSGPIAYALQAVFFHWLGVSYGAYLVSAAVFNAAAAWLGMAVTRLLFPSSRWLACGAGIVTAIWFYPPFGTFAAEQTAFFFGLAALWLALWALRVDPGRRLAGPALAWGAGLLCTLAVLSKQHAGLYLLPLPALLFGSCTLMFLTAPLWLPLTLRRGAATAARPQDGGPTCTRSLPTTVSGAAAGASVTS
jgi:hypothetical protein